MLSAGPCNPPIGSPILHVVRILAIIDVTDTKVMSIAISTKGHDAGDTGFLNLPVMSH
jgi:hypothetical protein